MDFYGNLNQTGSRSVLVERSRVTDFSECAPLHWVYNRIDEEKKHREGEKHTSYTHH